jgi:hypothetical protein
MRTPWQHTVISLTIFNLILSSLGSHTFGTGQANVEQAKDNAVPRVLKYTVHRTADVIAPLRATTSLTYTAFLPLAVDQTPHPVAFLPLVGTPAPTCPLSSTATYQTIAFNSNPYKNNRLTDENIDFRLSLLGYTAASEPLSLVHYGGDTDPDAPKLYGMFSPRRIPKFTGAYHVYYWNWDETVTATAPYGSRGRVNVEWPVTALDVATTRGETLSIPSRNASIRDSYKAMVLYASERELTIVYLWQDQVVVNRTGYTVHMLNFCVDPNLVALYRAQLSNGKRATLRLPAISNGQAVGSALTVSMTVAIRDGGAFMDPRSDKDWWAGLP